MDDGNGSPRTGRNGIGPGQAPASDMGRPAGPADDHGVVRDKTMGAPGTGSGGKRRRRRRREPGSVTTGIQGARTLPPALSEKLQRAEAALAQTLSNETRAKDAPPRAAPPALPADPSGRPQAFRDLPPAYAALDLGTNNCRLLVAVPTRPGQFRVVDAFSRIVRLGEGLGRTGSLGKGAMDRAMGALDVCREKLAARPISGARLIATEACRSAANGMEFIDRVRRETGLELEIVSREVEARLAVSGCGSLVDRSAKGAVLFDIGGGSTEIALLDLRPGYTPRLSNRIVAWTSLPVGVVTLAERYGGREVSADIFEAMVRHVMDRLDGFQHRDMLADIVDKPGFHLLGTSGTVTTLAGVHLGLERYDRRQVDGLWLTRTDVDHLVERIAGWSFEERIANPCIGSERADLVLAGCAILQAIRRVWPARALRVADRGLREGLLTEMMVADGVWKRGSRARSEEAVS